MAVSPGKIRRFHRLRRPTPVGETFVRKKFLSAM
jgi:hypothetical protein